MRVDLERGHRDSHDARLSRLTYTAARWRWLRNLLLGLAVIAGLWLTVTPGEDTARWVQLSLAVPAISGLMMSARWPVVAVVLTAGATAVAWLFGVTADPFVLTGFALFVLAEQRGARRFPWWMFAGAFIVVIASLGFGAEGIEDRFRGMLLSTVVLAASWVLGVRTRQVRRETEARSRAEERLRLVRDVHDVLSHSLGAIGVRAGVSAHVSALGESELRDVLREIETDARTSLSELKVLLRRERGADDSTSSLPLTAALVDVAQKAKNAGVDALLDTDRDVDRLPATVRTTVLRLVQEAVTNVIRHASASSLTITLRVFDDGVNVEVRDDGRGAPAEFREGHGVTGMRERVALMGGTLRVGSSHPGFTISAHLPFATSIEGKGVL